MINQKKTEISELIKTIENYTLSNSQIPSNGVSNVICNNFESILS